MQILSFDTNTKFIAWALTEVKNDQEKILNHGEIYEDKLYFHNLIELIKLHPIISVEDFRYYGISNKVYKYSRTDSKPRFINKDSIEAVKKIGHIQAACFQLHKILWQFTRPDILKYLFGSGRLNKSRAKQLFKNRLQSDLKGIPVHCIDAAMCGIHTHYQIIYYDKINETRGLKNG
jgi:hypothetical protein